MIAAYYRAAGGDETLLIEKNEKLGKKLYITGKGRCNVTNACEPDAFLDNVATNPKFLKGAIYRFPPSDFIDFLGRKLKLKTERGNRVYPESDKASDVTKCLESYLHGVGAEISLNEKVLDVKTDGEKVTGVETDKRSIPCDNVIVCTGGISYPSTGSDGDGYVWAEKLGHTVVKPKPALCGINLKTVYPELQGISLKNVSIKAFEGDKKIYEDFGEMLFTHFGVSGPVILSASSYLNKRDVKNSKITLDLKPAITEEQLDARILRDFEKYKNKLVKNSLDDLLLKAFIPVIIKNSGIDGNTKNSELKAQDRKKLVKAIKNFDLFPSSLINIDEAIVTSGGISVGEIDPKTMESKKVRGLFFAGEIIDVDALTGGFNVTIAACTGYCAGNYLRRKE